MKGRTSLLGSFLVCAAAINAQVTAAPAESSDITSTADLPGVTEVDTPDITADVDSPGVTEVDTPDITASPEVPGVTKVDTPDVTSVADVSAGTRYELYIPVDVAEAWDIHDETPFALSVIDSDDTANTFEVVETATSRTDLAPNATMTIVDGPETWAITTTETRNEPPITVILDCSVGANTAVCTETDEADGTITSTTIDYPSGALTWSVFEAVITAGTPATFDEDRADVSLIEDSADVTGGGGEEEAGVTHTGRISGIKPSSTSSSNAGTSSSVGSDSGASGPVQIGAMGAGLVAVMGLAVLL